MLRCGRDCLGSGFQRLGGDRLGEPGRLAGTLGNVLRSRARFRRPFRLLALSRANLGPRRGLPGPALRLRARRSGRFVRHARGPGGFVLVRRLERFCGKLVEGLGLVGLRGHPHHPLSHEVLGLRAVGDLRLLLVGRDGIGRLRLAGGRCPLFFQAEILVVVFFARSQRGRGARHRERGGLERHALALHPGRGEQRVVEIVLGYVQRDVHRRRDLAHQQMPCVVVQLALLLRERAHLAQCVQSLQDVEGPLQPSAGHAVRVLAVAHLPVELWVVGGSGELIEHRVDGLDARHLAQPDLHHLRPRHHHRRAVFLARQGHHLPVAPGDLLHLDPGDLADPLVRIDDPIADVEAAVADLDLGSLVRHASRTAIPERPIGQRNQGSDPRCFSFATTHGSGSRARAVFRRCSVPPRAISRASPCRSRAAALV